MYTLGEPDNPTLGKKKTDKLAQNHLKSSKVWMNWNEQLSVYWSYKLTLQQIKCSMCVVYYMYVSPHNVFSCIPHILCTKLPCTWAFRSEHLSMEVITWGKGLENLDTCSDMPIHQGECLGKCHIPEGSEHTTDCKHRT